jgi:rRNA-processing protein FCF1
LGNNLPVKVILDANFFFVPAKFKIDIFEALQTLLNQRYEPILLSTTHEELQTMAKKGAPAKRKQASLALQLAKKCRLVQVDKEIEETNDDIILRIAAEWKTPVATNDRELRKRLRAKSIPVIFLRGKTRLEMEGA